MNEYPKVLVVSHNCFSKSGSNGRTISNFFLDWPIDSLAQFYISNEIPDSDVCNNYFRVTDIEALKSIFNSNKSINISNEYSKLSNDKGKVFQRVYAKHKKRRSYNYIVRNFVWDSKRWMSDKFTNWIDDFAPDMVLIQLGDYSFMLRIALELAEKRGIPLVVYNSEDYYFKDKKSLSPLYNFYRHDYKRQVQKLISYSSCSVYNSEMLQQTYQKEFKHDSVVIMTSSDITPLTNKKINIPLTVSYLGSLGVGRHEPLIELAEALHKADPDIYLDIYGEMPNAEVEKLLLNSTGIRLKGFVPYEQVVRVIRTSDILVHAENFSEFYKSDLKHAFSTKIADYLSSGACFLYYGSDNLASTQYLLSHECACVITKRADLLAKIRSILDINTRINTVNKALEVAFKNHNAIQNSEEFTNLLKSKA